jgi:hypothetical protein
MTFMIISIIPVVGGTLAYISRRLMKFSMHSSMSIRVS